MGICGLPTLGGFGATCLLSTICTHFHVQTDRQADVNRRTPVCTVPWVLSAKEKTKLAAFVQSKNYDSETMTSIRSERIGP